MRRFNDAQAESNREREIERERSASLNQFYSFCVWRLLSVLRPLLVCFHHYIIKILMENNNSSMFWIDFLVLARPPVCLLRTWTGHRRQVEKKSSIFPPFLIEPFHHATGKIFTFFCEPAPSLSCALADVMSSEFIRSLWLKRKQRDVAQRRQQQKRNECFKSVRGIDYLESPCTQSFAETHYILPNTLNKNGRRRRCIARFHMCSTKHMLIAAGESGAKDKFICATEKYYNS